MVQCDPVFENLIDVSFKVQTLFGLFSISRVCDPCIQKAK